MSHVHRTALRGIARMTAEQAPIQASLRRVARALGLAVLAIGTAVIAGWALGLPELRSLLPGHAEMHANVAAGVALAGASAALQAVPSRHRAIAIFARVLALGSLAVGLATLAEHVLDVDLH